jgi:hypothetical protein
MDSQAHDGPVAEALRRANDGEAEALVQLFDLNGLPDLQGVAARGHLLFLSGGRDSRRPGACQDAVSGSRLPGLPKH